MKGERLFAGLVLGIFLAETVALGALAVVIIGHTDEHGPELISRVLLGALAVTMAAIAVVTAASLGSEAVAAHRLRQRRAALPTWLGRWMDVLDGCGAPPEAPLPEAAVDAFLELRERLSGPEEAQLILLGESAGLTATLLDWLRAPQLARRAQALEALAKARLASAVPPLLETLRTAPLSLRPMAARGLARTLATFSAGPHRAVLGVELAEGLATSTLSHGVIEEALLLLEEAAVDVVAPLLPPRTPARARAAAMGAVGSLRLVDLAEAVGHALVEPELDLELRTAALRALAQLGVPVPGCSLAILACLDSPDAGVRAAACSAASHLPDGEAGLALWHRLADRAWPVRLAAGEALLASAALGRALLERAALAHPDRYARDMAAQVLSDAGAALASSHLNPDRSAA